MIFNFLLVFLLGVVVTLIGTYRLAAGTLKVFISDQDDEGAYLGLDISKSVDEICSKKYVLLRVDVENLNTHK